MALAKRPTNLLKNKVNVRPVGNRLQEATAEDFAEICELLEDYADKLDALTGGDTPNQFYGVFTSLALLQASYPNAIAGAYAIIDQGQGQSARIALWDTTDSLWEIQETTATTTTGKIGLATEVLNVKVTDVNGDPYLIVSGTYEGPDRTKLESYSPNSIIRAL
ncbi:hypothetical protein LCGC14_0943670 [marine sediment metagenome]|uniref:Uncharacterized protein n=2 Tax=root TaxID=1 RepID=A0A831QKN0_9FLAO|nr:hypothetical protein [Pricia antarctica]